MEAPEYAIPLSTLGLVLLPMVSAPLQCQCQETHIIL